MNFTSTLNLKSYSSNLIFEIHFEDDMPNRPYIRRLLLLYWSKSQTVAATWRASRQLRSPWYRWHFVAPAGAISHRACARVQLTDGFPLHAQVNRKSWWRHAVWRHRSHAWLVTGACPEITQRTDQRFSGHSESSWRDEIKIENVTKSVYSHDKHLKLCSCLILLFSSSITCWWNKVAQN